MSRYVIPSSENISVVVGYDPPLETYFAQVQDSNLPEDEQIFLWCGALPTDKIPTVEALQKRIVEYCEIPPNTQAKLQRDKEEATEPSPLQQCMRKIFE